MFFFLNWIISAIIWLLIAYLFHFSILGWIIGLIISFVYKEFIGPLLIVSSGDKIINSANRRYEEKFSATINSPLLTNFDYKDNRESNYCIYYYHKNKGNITESDINFNLNLVKYKNELFRVGFSMIYDSRKRDDVRDILFCGKNLKFFDEEANLNFHRNEGVNTESYFFISPKSEYKNYFAQEGGNLTIIFRNSTETLKMTGKLLQALSETYNLGLYLNKL